MSSSSSLSGRYSSSGCSSPSVYFYAWEFDDFDRDELKFAMMRERHTEDGLVDHIIAQAQLYGLTTDRKNIRVETHPDSKSVLTFLAVDVNYRMAAIGFQRLTLAVYGCLGLFFSQTQLL